MAFAYAPDSLFSNLFVTSIFKRSFNSTGVGGDDKRKKGALLLILHNLLYKYVSITVVIK
jgi:hypothetical protein